MSRNLRQKSNIHIYHVVIKGADRQLLFEEKKDYIKYLHILEYYKQECHFELFAYCLMSNHVHLLLRHSSECSLETIFRKINTTYAVWFNMKYDRTGFVQNGRYFSEPVETERYLLTVLKYIHFNPTKAGLEPAPGASYPWSSFYEYQNHTTKLTDIAPIFEIIGNVDNFHKLHATVSNDTCLEIDRFRKRIPDDVAKDIIFEVSHCNTATDFQKLSLIQRDKSIKIIHEKGLSIRQINRLTGTPRGVVERILKK